MKGVLGVFGELRAPELEGLGSKAKAFRVEGCDQGSQTFQNPSIKEYTLNYNRIPNMNEGIFLN